MKKKNLRIFPDILVYLKGIWSKSYSKCSVIYEEDNDFASKTPYQISFQQRSTEEDWERNLNEYPKSIL